MIKEVIKVKGGTPRNQVKGKYRLQGKSLYITYSRCSMGLSDVYENLKEIIQVKTNRIKEYMLVREEHKDGGYHVHVYIEMIKKYDSEDPRRLDLRWKGYDGKSEEEKYHGKYEVAKNKSKVWEYMLKEIIGKEDVRLYISKGLEGKVGEYGQLINSYELAIKLAKEGKIWEALAVLERENPKDYISKRSVYENNLKAVYLGSKGLETKYNFNQYNIKPELKEILNTLQMLMAKGEGKALLLTGPTGTGKTLSMLAWSVDVLGIKPYITNRIDGLRYYTGEKLIIYDDIPNHELEDLGREEILKLVDCSSVDTTVNIKHGSQLIPGNTQKILIANIEFRDYNHKFNDAAVERRVIKYKVNETLIPEEKLMIKE